MILQTGPSEVPVLTGSIRIDGALHHLANEQPTESHYYKCDSNYRMLGDSGVMGLLELPPPHDQMAPRAKLDDRNRNR